uniref:Cadherin_2 domain-containing protein n=1 Tax=Trichobilharzia regenti TaxID=157069 RepID=A0AA85ISS0_TRIRE|nr:unnamed protein product [Trichobilharzia regenti]
MLNICLSEWSSYHINYHIHLVLIVCCINHLIESRTIRYQIDEELKINTPIGNLLSNIQSGVQNIRFIKISSTDDSSALFSVDQYSGDITIDHRLDREHLCSQSDRINKPDTYENLVTDWKSNVLTTQSTKCELYFSVNCLNVTPIKNLGNQNKVKRL